MLYTADKRNIVGVNGTVLKDAVPPRQKLWIFYPYLLQLNLLLLGALVGDITNGYVEIMIWTIRLEAFGVSMLLLEKSTGGTLANHPS